MKCSMCENQKKLKKQTIIHRYKECGLDNVVLNGVVSYSCESCGEKYLSFGNLENLHKKIVEILLMKKDLLTGKEIRFLRKHLGYSGIMFSLILDIAHETLSRIENNRQKIVIHLDHLVRFAIANKLPDRNYELHDLILKNEGRKNSRIELKLSSKGNWDEMKAA